MKKTEEYKRLILVRRKSGDTLEEIADEFGGTKQGTQDFLAKHFPEALHPEGVYSINRLCRLTNRSWGSTNKALRKAGIKPMKTSKRGRNFWDKNALKFLLEHPITDVSGANLRCHVCGKSVLPGKLYCGSKCRNKAKYNRRKSRSKETQKLKKEG